MVCFSAVLLARVLDPQITEQVYEILKTTVGIVPKTTTAVIHSFGKKKVKNFCYNTMLICEIFFKINLTDNRTRLVALFRWLGIAIYN